MRVIKPQKMTDAILTSSTISEPDAGTAEQVWFATKGLIYTARTLESTAWDGVNFWGLENDTVHKYDSQWNDLAAPFSAPLFTKSITCSSTTIYTLSKVASRIITPHSLAGVPGTPAVVGGLGEPVAILYDGAHVLYYEQGRYPASMKIHRYDPTTLLFVDSLTITGFPNVNVTDIAYDESYYYVTDTISEKILRLNRDMSDAGGSIPFDVGDISNLLFADDSFFAGSDDFGNYLHPYDKFFTATGGYMPGDRVIKTNTHKVYQAAEMTFDDPEDGVEKDIPSWTEVGPTNRWAMFDDVSSVGSFSLSDVVVELTPDDIFQGLAAFGVEGVSNVNVTVTDPIDGVVYDEDVAMINDDEIIDWYAYLFTNVEFSRSFVLLDLPAYINATIKITFTGSGIVIGAIKWGEVITLGKAEFGGQIRLLDYSDVSEDDFGNLKIEKRPSAKLVDYSVVVDKSKLNYAYRQLERLVGIPAVWVGTDNVKDESMVYGPYRDNVIGVDTPSVCKLQLKIRGLI